MARLETTIKQIAPGGEGALIHDMERFGWQVTGSQEVVSNHKEKEGDMVWEIHEKYVKITFQRDKDMDFYNEIVLLENKINSRENEVYNLKKQRISTPSKKGFVITGLIGVFMLIAGIIYAITQSITGAISFLVIGPILVVVSVILFFKFKKKKSNNKVKLEEQAKDIEKAQKQLEPLYQELSKYM